VNIEKPTLAERVRIFVIFDTEHDADLYAVPYEPLMEKAGYLLPAEVGGGRRQRLAAFAIDDLTAEEEEDLLKYLAFLRWRSSK
jgi:hypothetical protein